MSGTPGPDHATTACDVAGDSSAPEVGLKHSGICGLGFGRLSCGVSTACTTRRLDALAQRTVDPLVEVDRYFDHAFAVSCSATGEIDADMLELLPSFTFSYSERTADWLTAVVQDPQNADASYLQRIFKDESQPLGALIVGFRRLFEALHRTHVNDFRQPALHKSQLHAYAAAATLRLGARRFVALVLEVMPPLRATAPELVRDAVEAAIFAAVQPTLAPLLHLATRGDDAFAARVYEMATNPQQLPEWLGLPARWGTDPAVLLASAVDAARAIPACVTPRAKLGCFLRVCDAIAGQSQLGADDLIPACAYALVAARLCTLPTELLLIKLFVTDCDELLGRMGYGLATLEAVTSFVATLTMGPTAREGTAGAECCEVPSSATETGSADPAASALQEYCSDDEPPFELRDLLQPGCGKRRPSSVRQQTPNDATSAEALDLAWAAAEMGAKWIDEAAEGTLRLSTTAATAIAPHDGEGAPPRPQQLPRKVLPSVHAALMHHRRMAAAVEQAAAARTRNVLPPTQPCELPAPPSPNARSSLESCAVAPPSPITPPTAPLPSTPAPRFTLAGPDASRQLTYALQRAHALYQSSDVRALRASSSPTRAVSSPGRASATPTRRCSPAISVAPPGQRVSAGLGVDGGLDSDVADVIEFQFDAKPFELPPSLHEASLAQSQASAVAEPSEQPSVTAADHAPALPMLHPLWTL